MLHECVEAYRTLAARSPETYRAGLADALDEFAGRLAATGLVEEALALFDEAARLLTLADADVLAQVTTRQANLLARVGRVDEAIDRADSAVRLRRSSAEATPGPADDALAAALQSFGLLLSGAKRHDEAVESLEEAVSLRARRVRMEPALARRPEVAVTYAVYGLVLISADRPADAVPPLAAALGVGTALNLPQVVDMATDALVRAHAAEPVAVRSRWRAATGEDAPPWITGGTAAVRRAAARDTGSGARPAEHPSADDQPRPGQQARPIGRTDAAARNAPAQPPEGDAQASAAPPQAPAPRTAGRLTADRLAGDRPVRRPIPAVAPPPRRPRTDIDA
ncbi:tetratricopeptide repeat protein [Yinghuangia sp. KLBMP8922]|uniref:Tetratricopeptide repeat protein n=1 Tax=Yinghuangia soli TaxID=2908204 RepID=A0AA41Q2R4_9ACTN|nr:tetratricopeptide repeat protein [Yinghuangia soli]